MGCDKYDSLVEILVRNPSIAGAKREIITLFFFFFQSMQVMVRVEPKLSGIDKELLQLREQIDMEKEYIATISAEFESYTQRIKIIEVQIKEKDTQFARFHRCRLCLAENLTPRSREKFVKRTTTKRFSGANTKAEVQEEQSPEELLQASLAAQESHTSEEGKGPLLQPEN
jgi:peptidoglycan hydrolase CwlO-like protein